jgi:predicted Zn-ribbon and HTH transcriptional regulator
MNVKELTCTKCSYKWFPIKGKAPKVCPRCKSYKWDDVKEWVKDIKKLEDL